MTSEIPGAIIVLGSPNAKDGRLYDVAVGRCETALNVYRKHPDYKFILTGGFGSHFNQSNQPHAYYLAQCLINSGIQEKDILEFAESANSIEDALLSRPIVEKYNIRRLIIVTSDYHAERAEFIFTKVYEDLDVNISFSAADTNIENSELDIRRLIQHEKTALQKLKKNGLEKYYEN
jgi:uncharacterized SAM-binding protein YcdF (DUF218 family)